MKLPRFVEFASTPPPRQCLNAQPEVAGQPAPLVVERLCFLAPDGTLTQLEPLSPYVWKDPVTTRMPRDAPGVPCVPDKTAWPDEVRAGVDAFVGQIPAAGR
jgi:hypothetical protein